MQELIEAAEKNAKGSIDQAEFMTLWVAFKAKVGEEGETEAEIKTAFKEYDLDGDGYITKDEMVEVGRVNLSPSCLGALVHNKKISPTKKSILTATIPPEKGNFMRTRAICLI